MKNWRTWCVSYIVCLFCLFKSYICVLANVGVSSIFISTTVCEHGLWSMDLYVNMVYGVDEYLNY